MKRIILSTVVAVFAIAASAFTNVEKVNRFAVTFYHVGSLYTTTIPTGTCQSTTTKACTITYPSSSLTSFPDTSIPSGGTPSSALGAYQ